MTDFDDVLPQANATVQKEITQLKSRNHILRRLIQRRAAIIAEAQQALETLERERAIIETEFSLLQQSVA